MPAPDGTLLCLFSNDKCIVIDDFVPQLKGVYQISQVWPNLSGYHMDSMLDAAYYCPEFTEVAFFKNDQCAIYNYKSNAWKQGKISDYYAAPAAAGDSYYSNLTAASTGVNDVYYAFYQGTKYINGPIAGQDPMAGGKVQLTHSTGDLTTDGWKLSPTQKLVASTLVAELTAYGAKGKGTLQRALFVLDSSDGQYKLTFDQENVPNFTPVPGVIPMTSLWSQYDDATYPIQAATRVDPALFANVNPLPTPAPDHLPHQGPGPVVNPNPLCDELGNIMKSVCSLTLLMHKAIDACYPPNLWPTQPYPDGCSSSGHKHHGCGCQGKTPGMRPGPVLPPVQGTGSGSGSGNGSGNGS